MKTPENRLWPKARMNGTNRPIKLLRCIPAALGLLFGGYLLISFLGSLLGLIFTGGIVLGGVWILRHFLNRLDNGKTIEIPEENPVKDHEDLNLELEELKKRTLEKDR